VADRRNDARLPIVIVGAGLAGLWCALNLAPRRVIVLAGAAEAPSSSAWAQGGLAAALDPEDSPTQHAEDTIRAGAGLSDPLAARLLTAAAAAEVEHLAAAGVPFERDRHGRWALSREAAHGRARVARIGGDGAGAALIETLRRSAASAEHIDLRTGAWGAGLVLDAGGRCAGVLVAEEQGRRSSLHADAVVLATGGLGGLYAIRTVPGENLGQALAWSARAGATIRDAEFVQFHPTAMKVGRAPAPLATEALRGDGATLIDADGERFMIDVHPDAELAPRDIVARAVHGQDRAGGAWLDARCIGEAWPERYPTVFAACRAAGLDPRRDPIPVAPAAHYHMGGVATDLAGRTGVDGLRVIGEAACTGVHGANRLASNSLLEAVVMARLAAEDLRDGPASAARGPFEPLAARSLPTAALEDLRAAMQRDAGVERDGPGLTRLAGLLAEAGDRHGPADELLAARAVCEAALLREESRGAHLRSDFPEVAPAARPSRWRLPGARATATTEFPTAHPESQA
jgi:L-aspartate oxidase